MKQFTLKDFINYNNPCKVCNTYVNIVAEIHDTDNEEEYISITGVLEDHNLLFKLFQNYYDSLELMVNPKNNYIYPLAKSQASTRLQSYIKDNNFFFYTSCSKCHTSVESKVAEFVLAPIYPYIKPLEISFENINLVTSNCYYALRSTLETNTTKLFVHDLRTNVRESFETPLVQLSELKSSEEILERIRIILAFS